MLGTPSQTITVPLPAGAPAGPPTALVASFDQNGALVTSEPLPPSDAANGVITFPPPTSLPAGTYAAVVTLAYGNGTLMTAGPVAYTQP